jgi:hypothetical protein
MSSFFDSVPVTAPNEIYYINRSYFQDPNPLKVNLSIGGECLATLIN